MSPGISIIVGLGNPGEKYENTRHNAGAWFINEIANKTDAILKSQPKFQGQHAITQFNGQELHLFIPSTFMNLSGQAVRSVMNYYKIPATQLLVSHDEIDLPIGDIRLKLGGGHGGHNGLKDIMQNIHTQEFYRLRIGVGRPNNSKDVVDYVLQSPGKTERTQIDDSIQKGLSVVPGLLKGEFQKMMQELHTKK